MRKFIPIKTCSSNRFFSKAEEGTRFLPVITDQLVLSPVREDEWEDFYSLYGDIEVMKLFDNGKIYTKEKTQALVAEYASAWRQKNL